MAVCTLCKGQHRKADCPRKITLRRTEAANLLQEVRHQVAVAPVDLATVLRLLLGQAGVACSRDGDFVEVR